jgi:hypothetical protein
MRADDPFDGNLTGIRSRSISAPRRAATTSRSLTSPASPADGGTMNRFACRTLAASAAWLMSLILIPAGPLLAAGGGASAPGAAPYVAHYHIHFLDLHTAEQLAWDQCAGRECRVSWVSGELELYADAATHEKMARALVRADAPYTQSFQLTLVAANRAAGATEPDLPKPALKALQDLKDFFPYQSYRVLDIAWLRTTGHAEAHLVGDRGTPFSAELQYTRIGDPAARELLVEHFEVRAETPVGAAGGSGSVLKPQEAPARAWENLIKTTFGMHVGETVVVGTSKLGGTGDAALVVLLTAVP